MDDNDDVHHSTSKSWCSNIFLKKRRRRFDPSPSKSESSSTTSRRMLSCWRSPASSTCRSQWLKLVWNVKKYGDFWQRQFVRTFHFIFMFVSTGGPRYLQPLVRQSLNFKSVLVGLKVQNWSQITRKTCITVKKIDNS